MADKRDETGKPSTPSSPVQPSESARRFGTFLFVPFSALQPRRTVDQQ